jgi:hypothetical protein
VLADKAYDADRIRGLIQDQGATPNIPPKSNRRWKPCFSKRLYRERNLIERFFSKLKHFRRVATRYDKLAANFLAMIQLAELMSLRPSTTLADLLMPPLVANPFSTMRASLWRWSSDEFEDGLAYCGQSWLRRRPVDSFFSALLLRADDAGGRRKRSSS